MGEGGGGGEDWSPPHVELGAQGLQMAASTRRKLWHLLPQAGESMGRRVFDPAHVAPSMTQSPAVENPVPGCFKTSPRLSKTQSPAVKNPVPGC